eukprot:evm.model.scf_1668.5 EVM.evm.TU.scf_1668.5   scf_1668:27419-33693(-)
MRPGRLPAQRVIPLGMAPTLGRGQPARGPIRLRYRSQEVPENVHIEGPAQETSTSDPKEHSMFIADRRTVNMAALSTFFSMWVQEEEAAEASKLPQAMDRVWEGIGGGPADLVFPREFLGVWDTLSTLVSVETPLGTEFVPNLKVVERAKTELNVPLQYSVNFVENSRNEVITDRRYNTASLMEMYYGTEIDFVNRINWNPDDPNVLKLSLPGGTDVLTRVTKRSEDRREANRLDTSEFFEQVFDDPSQEMGPKVTASRCFTKYKWRNEEEASADGGPTIVATQVVSDYLTGYSDERLSMRARGRPVVIYTYRMAFARHWPLPGETAKDETSEDNFVRIA